MDRRTVFDYIRKKYMMLPEYPWQKYDNNTVFRHPDNKKWFVLVMGVQRIKLCIAGDAYVDVVNLKIEDMFYRDLIIREDGIMPAYCYYKLRGKRIQGADWRRCDLA